MIEGLVPATDTSNSENALEFQSRWWGEYPQGTRAGNALITLISFMWPVGWVYIDPIQALGVVGIVFILANM